jgi:transglutaminase-like putative cysteine protease
MRWKIVHELTYRYSRPVAIDAQTIRLQPRRDARQQLLRFKLNIKPKPSFQTHYTDIENNALTTAWFTGEHPELKIVTSSEVKLRDYDPYDFILIELSLGQLPLTYREMPASLISLYTDFDNKASTALRDFLQPILLESNYETIPFLNSLLNYIFSRFKRKERRDGKPWEPEKTIEKRQGACRDLAWLYIVACRSLGIATRFVSGYHIPFNPRKKPELHAWAEVFLPGAGWIGLDPSTGLAVDERYIAISASYNPALTLPTGGTYWGKNTKAVLKATISIESMA